MEETIQTAVAFVEMESCHIDEQSKDWCRLLFEKPLKKRAPFLTLLRARVPGGDLCHKAKAPTEAEAETLRATCGRTEINRESVPPYVERQKNRAPFFCENGTPCPVKMNLL